MKIGGEDDGMGDVGELQAKDVVRVSKVEEVVRVNEGKELGRVNEVVRHVYSRGQPSKRKKPERILKLKLAKGLKVKVVVLDRQWTWIN
ncbi:unnamed protein product [Lactuca virosa]|uniref:KOW domain-containing protein n=1 Tax=Lactuca virosa TaxID=75947 RepID=A0AAU9P5N1_9ASTR|nr:unnamed protein product [Lactuca virosa]